jgi:heme/copper-type cytochrome/quinol oxidase subunit 2
VKLSPEFARFVFWICVASCVVGQLAILRSTVRGPAARASGDDAANPVHIRRAPEIIWAVLPVIALIFVFAGTWRVLHFSDATTTQPLHRHPPTTVSRAPTSLATSARPQKRSRAASVRMHVAPALQMVDLNVADAVEDFEDPRR